MRLSLPLLSESSYSVSLVFLRGQRVWPLTSGSHGRTLSDVCESKSHYKGSNKRLQEFLEFHWLYGGACWMLWDNHDGDVIQ